MPQNPIYLEVAVPTPLRRTFHYLPPADTSSNSLLPGIRVSVPFGGRKVTGILTGTSNQADVEADKVKRVYRVLDREPVIPNATMKLSLWAADYYHHPIGEVLATAIPVLLRQGEATLQAEEILVPTQQGIAIDLAELKRAPAQTSLLRQLRASSGLARLELRNAGVTSATIRALVEKSLATWTTREPLAPQAYDPANLVVREMHQLTQEQATAVTQISSHAGTTLLFGVTGSGKTEVYLQVIAKTLGRGEQALILVPEIGLTPQTTRRFSERFNVPVVAIHSGLNDRERLAAWNAASSGSCGIVIGTRSAIFTPLKSPGVIVIDEEHDASFKQQDGFRYSARDLAVMRGQMEKTSVILGSATPSLESWYNAKHDKYKLARLAGRTGAASQPTYRVLDIRGQALVEGFSPSLIGEITEHLDRGNQVLVFLNRRGFSPVLLCRNCGWMAQCHRCDARLTLHSTTNALICHHCGSQARVGRLCPQCESDQLVALGAGTQRLERALEEMFKAYPIIRIDRDSTRTKDAMDKFMDRIEKGNPAILVGTQMLAKGHHFPNVTLVAIVDMDSGFYSANFKAAERMGQLILQVGGRAGRAEKPGVVTIQTHLPDQPLFRLLVDEGYEAFADRLLEEREQHDLPPFFFQALIRADATSKDLPLNFLGSIASTLRPVPSVEVLGPVPSSMERRAGRYRAQLLLTSRHRKTLSREVTNCIAIATQSSLARKVRWSVDVDPVDLF